MEQISERDIGSDDGTVLLEQKLHGITSDRQREHHRKRAKLVGKMVMMTSSFVEGDAASVRKI